VAWNLPWMGANRVSLEYDYGHDLLAGLPPRAVFFIGGDDIIYPVLYLQGVERFREDVVSVPEGFLTFGPARGMLARRLPEAARILSQPGWLRTEDEWSNEAARLALAAGRRVFLTNPLREGVSVGLVRENRDLVYEVYDPAHLTVRGSGRGQESEAPAKRGSLKAAAPALPAGILWMRARGWYAPARGLTKRQKGIIGLYGKYLRQYAYLLSNTGRVAESLLRYRRASANPYMEDQEGALNNLAVALERTGDVTAALGIYGRLAARSSVRPEVYLNAGNLLLKLGKQEEAAVMFTKALKLAPAGSRYAAYASAQLAKLQGRKE
jgi:tetratricopeptide (TPR) repeat protein